MRISLEWLAEILHKSISLDALLDVLPRSGFEIDSIETIGKNTVLEISVTPNRSDVLSLYGFAREVAALFDWECPSTNGVVERQAQYQTQVEIHIKEAKACPLYEGRVLRGINNRLSLPTKITDRLTASGLRSINPVVDILNYVMLEYGQPLHAFDTETLGNRLDVRFATANEPFTTLTEANLTLADDALIIASAQGVEALAGIIGSQASQVTANTVNIFLESAHFNPITIAKTQRKLGMITDAAYRFERYVDPSLAKVGMDRAVMLILEQLGGEVSQPLTYISERYLPKSKHISLDRNIFPRVLGTEIADQTIAAILTRLGFHITVHHEGWEVQVPLFRNDVSLDVDLVEEVARVYGYQNIPAASFKFDATELIRCVEAPHDFCEKLTERGYAQVMNYAFIPEAHNVYFDREETMIRVKNPISADMSVMRKSLLPGLLNNLAQNMSHQCERVHLFEVGPIFLPKGKHIDEKLVFSAVIFGERAPLNWADQPRRKVDFFDLKGDLMHIWPKQHILTFDRAEVNNFHPGKTAKIFCDDAEIGIIGQLLPEFALKWDIDAPIYAFEIVLPKVNKSMRYFKVFSRFPRVRRDLALIVDGTIEAEELMALCRLSIGEPLQTVNIFDIYAGKNIPEGKKSLAISLELQCLDRTLTDEEVQGMIETLLATLRSKIGAVLRAA